MIAVRIEAFWVTISCWGYLNSIFPLLKRMISWFEAHSMRIINPRSMKPHLSNPVIKFSFHYSLRIAPAGHLTALWAPARAGGSHVAFETLVSQESRWSNLDETSWAQITVWDHNVSPAVGLILNQTRLIWHVQHCAALHELHLFHPRLEEYFDPRYMMSKQMLVTPTNFTILHARL